MSPKDDACIVGDFSEKNNLELNRVDCYMIYRDVKFSASAVRESQNKLETEVKSLQVDNFINMRRRDISADLHECWRP